MAHDILKHYKEIPFDEFLFKMLSIGKPLETSLVGAFDDTGRGSRRDIDLPLHRDGDYSTAFKDKIDYVGLYCFRGGDAETIIKFEDKVKKINLKPREAIIFNNKLCRHGREGAVGDRVLLRIWISSS